MKKGIGSNGDNYCFILNFYCPILYSTTNFHIFNRMCNIRQTDRCEVNIKVLEGIRGKP
jgi:hypothetical protein